jgi:hypothetical protein
MAFAESVEKMRFNIVVTPIWFGVIAVANSIYNHVTVKLYHVIFWPQRHKKIPPILLLIGGGAAVEKG